MVPSESVNGPINPRKRLLKRAKRPVLMIGKQGGVIQMVFKKGAQTERGGGWKFGCTTL